MTKQKILRLPDALADAFETEARNQKGKSENDLFIEALEHFLSCKKEDVSAAMKLIVLKYPGKCLKHGGEVPAGTWAWYGRGVGIICLDCFVQRIGDKAVVAKYLKKREYEQVIKALKAEADNLADKVEKGQLIEKVERLYNSYQQLYEMVTKYLKEGIGTTEEKQRLEDMSRLGEEVKGLVKEISEFLYMKKQARKRKSTEKYAEEA